MVCTLGRSRYSLLIWGLVFALQPASGLWAQEEDSSAEEQFAEALFEIQNENYKEAAALLKQVVEADDENGRAWQLYGYSLHMDGKLDDAIKVHERTAKFAQFKGISLYNLGCAHALKKDTDKCLGFLKKAVDAGFDDVEQFESDADLAFVKKDPRFVRLIKVMKGEPVDDDEKKAAKWIGTWVYVSGVRAGEDVAKERLAGEVEIGEKTLTIPAGPDSEFVMAYEIDKSKKPAAIDLEIESGPVNEGTALGIIKMDEGKLVLCYDPTGQNRPEKFESTSENGAFLFVLKKKEDDEEENDK